MKKSILSLALCFSLFLGAISAKPAQAGIILLPGYGVGVICIILGVIYDSVGLIILDGSSSGQNALAKKLDQKYPMIENKEVLTDLANAIVLKAEAAQTNSEQVKTVSLTEEEVRAILAPTALDVLNPEALNQIVSDLK